MKLKMTDGSELELVYSFRSAIYFEQIANHSLDFNNFTSNDLILLFYSVFVASLQKAKKELVNMIDFLDIIDNNGGDKCLVEFANYYIDRLKKEYEVINDMSEDIQPEQGPQAAKKKID